MRRKITLVFILILLCSFSTLTVLAFPGIPFSGQAIARGIHVDLQSSSSSVDINVLSERTDISGDIDSPVQTDGRSRGVVVELLSGDLKDVDANLVNATSTKIYDGSTAVVFDSDSMPNINSSLSPLVTTAVIEAISSSRVTGLVGWSVAGGSANNVIVNGAVGGPNIVSVQNISNQSGSETTPAHILFSNSASVLTNIDVQMPYEAKNINILTADVLTATATTSSDGTLSNANADSIVEFLNLEIAGSPISTPNPGDVYFVTSGAVPVNVARVTIMPVLFSTFDANNSSAEAVSLLIELLEGPLAGTEIFLGHVIAESIADTNPTGPTAISMKDNSTNNYAINQAGILIITSLFGILTIASAFILLQRKRMARIETRY